MRILGTGISFLKNLCAQDSGTAAWKQRSGKVFRVNEGNQVQMQNE
jgi:hypothetical protein